jgi:SAM-dependent methyltransferase
MDGIFAECVLSLASDKASVLAECRRTLKTEGRLVISDIILRGGEDGPARTGLAEVPCVKGASPLSELLSLLRRYGFSTLHVEDHGNLLGELAAALVFEFGSLDAFLELWNDDSRRRAGHGCALPDISPEKENRFPFTPAVSDACGRRGKACPPGANLGYTLIIAVKFGDRA